MYKLNRLNRLKQLLIASFLIVALVGCEDSATELYPEVADLTRTYSDLSFGTFAITEAGDTVTVGTDINVRFIVVNSGSESSVQTTLKYYQSESNGITGSTDTSLADLVSTNTGTILAGADRSIIALNSNSSYQVNDKVSLGSSFTGTYYYSACLEFMGKDDNDANKNDDEYDLVSKTVCSSAHKIYVGVAPDLRILEVNAVNVGVVAKTEHLEVEFSYLVDNAGYAESAAGELQLIMSFDSSFDSTDDKTHTVNIKDVPVSNDVVQFVSTSDTVLASVAVAPLDDKTETAIVSTGKVLVASTSKTFFFRACIKEQGNESDTNNNCYDDYEVNLNNTVTFTTGQTDAADCLVVVNKISVNAGESCNITSEIIGQYNLGYIGIMAGNDASCSTTDDISLGAYRGESTINLNGLAISCTQVN